MKRRVMVRQPMQRGENRLIPADVLAESNGILRVKVQGQTVPVEVKASDTVPMTAVFGNRGPSQQRFAVQKEQPRLHTLGQILG